MNINDPQIIQIAKDRDTFRARLKDAEARLAEVETDRDGWRRLWDDVDADLAATKRRLAEYDALLRSVPLPPAAITWERGVELLNELQRLAVRAADSAPAEKESDDAE